MKSILTHWKKILFVPIAFMFVGANNDLVKFTVYNDSEYSIYYLYLSNSNSDQWGEDRLGDEVLSPGESFSTLVYPSAYDIKMIDEDDDVCIMYNVNVREDIDWRFGTSELLDCMGYGDSNSSSSSSTSGTVGFTIRNNSQWSIYYIYMSGSDQAWGDDHLGDEVLSSGESITIRVRPGTYDLKMQDEDGDECIRWGFSIDEDLSWSFGDDEWLDCIY